MLACLVFSGCSLFEHSATCTTRKLIPPESFQLNAEAERPDFCHYQGALAAWYVPYAIMSLNAYRPDGLDDMTADRTESCQDQTNKVRCPEAWVGSRLGEEGRYFEANNRATGLFMESFEREYTDESRKTRHVEYVLAFRGSEFTDVSDWRANFRWFMPGLRAGDEYPEARQTSVEWVASACRGLGTDFDQLDVTMAGHSLGGGLAQNAGYAVARALQPGLAPASGELSDQERKEQELLAACPQEKVRVRVVAFDPSPVTGYRDEQGLPRCENPLSRRCRAPIIMRLYEKGEILAPLRRVVSWFNPLWPNICEDRYSSAPGGPWHLPITQHQMRRLAGGLVWMARTSGDPDAISIYDQYCPQGKDTPSRDPVLHREPLLDCGQPEFDCSAD